MELYILSNQPNTDFLRPVPDPFYHLFPVSQIRRRRLQMQLSADYIGKTGLFQHQRRFIKIPQCSVFNDTILFYVAEQGNFPENGLFQRSV